MADLITAPVRFIAGIPVAATDAVFNIFSGDNKTKTSTPGTSVYKLASPKLDLCCLIYFYTELRSSTRKLCKAFADEKNMSYQKRDSPSDVEVLYNALEYVDTCLEALNTSSSDSTAALAKYQKSLTGLDNLTTKFKLTKGDVQIFKQYFEIISKKPKYYTDILRDLRLYHEYISPLFRVSFGGTDFNIQQVEDLVNRDETSYIHYIDDDFTSTSLNPTGFINKLNSEVVYAICVSDKHKTISVVFRGSVNANDWVSNVNANLVDCLFPGFTTDRGMSKVKRQSFGTVHEGFYDYLFGETQEGKNGSTKSKGEEIMGMITSLLNDEKRKDYKIHITGHSLGGALSTLMSARAAALNEFKTTIINVSYASPFVGDQSFREAFYKLEKSKSIKHLRISNFEDVVPLIPFISTTVPPVPLKHTGLNIKLFDKSLLHPYHYHLSYPKKNSMVSAVRNTLHTSLFNGFNLNIAIHLCPVYAERLDAAKDDLMMLDFDKLYSDSNLTGWEYDEVDSSPEEEKKE